MVNQFLTFKLDGATYAVEVHKVQEVLEYTHITKVPCIAEYFEGLINSRGKGITVVNFRKKFAMETVPVTKQTRIIVLEIKKGNEIVTFGAIADSVQEVIDLEESEIEPPPKFGSDIAAQYIKGIGKRNDEFLMILSIDEIFSTDEVINLKNVVVLPEEESEEESED